MVCWLTESCVAAHPHMLPEIDLFHEAFVDGDVSLMLDLQSLLHDKSPRNKRNNCSTLQVAYRKISERSLAKIVGKATALVHATTLEKNVNSPSVQE